MTMIGRALKSAGIDLDNDRETWIAQRDPWNLDQWLAGNPTPRTAVQDAELADHIAHRQRLVGDYWAQLPAETVQRIHDAIEADRRRWAIEHSITTRAAAETAPPGGNPEYVHAAVRADLDKLAAATEGARNDTLLRVSCNVFEFVKGGHAEHDPVWAELRRIAGVIGLDHTEIESTLRSAWGRVGPRSVPARNRNRNRTDATTFNGGNL